MSRINGERARANIAHKNRVARREKSRAARAAAIAAGAAEKPAEAPAGKKSRRSSSPKE